MEYYSAIKMNRVCYNRVVTIWMNLENNVKVKSHSVVSNSLQPWNFPGQNT